MKTLKTTVLITIISLIVSSCYKRENWGVKGKGELVTETRQTSSFNSINLSCDADVSYIHDEESRIEVSAQSNILPLLNTEVHNGELAIDFDRNVWNHKKVKVTVYGPTPERIRVSGSGQFTALSDISAGSIHLNVSGSGQLKMNSLQAESTNAHVSGSGRVEIAGGSTDNSNFTVSGSGSIDAEYFTTTFNHSTISGSGHIRINASENINVTISGSGTLYYSGNPEIIANITGSGKIRRN